MFLHRAGIFSFIQNFPPGGRNRPSPGLRSRPLPGNQARCSPLASVAFLFLSSLRGTNLLHSFSDVSSRLPSSARQPPSALLFLSSVFTLLVLLSGPGGSADDIIYLVIFFLPSVLPVESVYPWLVPRISWQPGAVVTWHSLSHGTEIIHMFSAGSCPCPDAHGCLDAVTAFCLLSNDSDRGFCPYPRVLFPCSAKWPYWR